MPIALILLIGVVCAEDRVQSELQFAAHTKDEKTAGVWVDGQYVGFVKGESFDPEKLKSQAA